MSDIPLASSTLDELDDTPLAGTPQQTDPAPIEGRLTVTKFLQGATAVHRTVTICPDGQALTEFDLIREQLYRARATKDPDVIQQVRDRYDAATARYLAASLRFTFEGRTREWVATTRRRYFDAEGVKYTFDAATQTVTTEDGADVTAVTRAITAQFLDQLVSVHAVNADDTTGEPLNIDDLTVDDIVNLDKVLPAEAGRLAATCALANGESPESASVVDFS